MELYALQRGFQPWQLLQQQQAAVHEKLRFSDHDRSLTRWQPEAHHWCLFQQQLLLALKLFILFEIRDVANVHVDVFWTAVTYMMAAQHTCLFEQQLLLALKPTSVLLVLSRQ